MLSIAYNLELEIVRNNGGLVTAVALGPMSRFVICRGESMKSIVSCVSALALKPVGFTVILNA